jgi:hypothetical protein
MMAAAPSRCAARWPWRRTAARAAAAARAGARAATSSSSQSCPTRPTRWERDAALRSGRGSDIRSCLVRSMKFYTASAQGAPSVDCGVASQADLVANIADLVNRGVIAGIADVRDESDRTGMRVVVEARTGSAPEVPLLSVVGIATTRSFSVPRSCRNLWLRAPCSSSPVRFVAGHSEQPVQAHSAAVALRLQHGRPGGQHPAVPQPQGLPAPFPGLQVCCTSCVSCL